jgi:hypothetical protein
VELERFSFVFGKSPLRICCRRILVFTSLSIRLFPRTLCPTSDTHHSFVVIHTYSAWRELLRQRLSNQRVGGIQFEPTVLTVEVFVALTNTSKQTSGWWLSAYGHFFESFRFSFMTIFTSRSTPCNTVALLMTHESLLGISLFRDSRPVVWRFPGRCECLFPKLLRVSQMYVVTLQLRKRLLRILCCLRDWDVPGSRGTASFKWQLPLILLRT